jgi:hypothetical protein
MSDKLNSSSDEMEKIATALEKVRGTHPKNTFKEAIIRNNMIPDTTENVDGVTEGVSGISLESNNKEQAFTEEDLIQEGFDRNLLLFLAKKRWQMKSLLESLPNAQYISRWDRDILEAALKLYDVHQSQDSSKEILELRQSTNKHLTVSFQKKILDRIRVVLEERGSEIEHFEPETDDERFLLMIDSGHNIMSNAVEIFQRLKMVSVKTNGKKFTVCGENSESKFFSDVKSEWGFEKPRKYFEYIGNVGIPQGSLDYLNCNDISHITSGTT